MSALPPLSVQPPPQSLAAASQSREAVLRNAAAALEATFLSEMLKSAGLGEARQSMGGGIGEEQFGSFLRQAQAENMVKAGGIGLAEYLFQALSERTDVR